MENAKIKINITTGEIEISGSEEFVTSHINNVDELISLFPKIKSRVNHNVADNTSAETPSEAIPSSSEQDTPELFGEWFHSFEEDLSETDQALIAGYFIQQQSEENEFKTREVTDLLKEHGIVLSNTSLSLSRLKDKKSIFQTRKIGKTKYYRVSRTGESELEELKK